MHKRLVSYVIFLATIIAVLMVVVVQPRTARLKHSRSIPNASLFADTCTVGNMGMTCDEYAAMIAAATCGSNGGVWNGTSCSIPTATSATTCQAAGFTWDAQTQTCLMGSESSSGSSAPPVIDGVGTSEKVSQRIESTCLDHVAKSGYAATLLQYGWFDNIRIYAKNACTLAYLIINGKFSSNDDLYLVGSLIANDAAVRQEDIGVLYEALERTPAQGTKTLNDYLDAKNKGSAAWYLKSVMDIMSALNDLTTDQKQNPPYLTEPLPYITKKAAAAYNARHGTKIISLEELLEELLNLMSQPAEIAAKEPEQVQEAKKEEPAPETAQTPQKTREESTSIGQRVAVVFNNVVNILKGIREKGIENGIERKALTQDLGKLTKQLEYEQAVTKAFNEAHDALCKTLDC